MISIKRTFFVVLLLVSLFCGCYKTKIKESAIGKIEEIAVCSANVVYSAVEKELLNALFAEVSMPATESVFFTVFVTLDKLHIYKREKNIIFITNINRNDEYSKIINGFLSKEDMERVKKERVIFFTIFDGFAKGQNIFIIAGDSEEDIKNSIKERGEDIKKFFLENSFRSLEMMVYFTGENRRLGNEIFQKTKIKLRVPSDYETAFFDKDMNAYGIIAHYPERVVIISRTEDTSKFTFSFMESLRNKIGEKYFDGDAIDTQYIKLKKIATTFKGYPALEMQGIYANNVKQYGGPFISYLVKANGKLYYLDGHIFLPGDRKFFKLMETKTIMNTVVLEED